MARPESIEQYRAMAAESKGKPLRLKRVAGKVRAVPTEHEEQVALFEWAAIHARNCPELARLFAIPNAGAGAQRGQAGKMKAEGVKPGVPDLFLPVARGGYHGLFIELKALDGALRPDQRGWIEYLHTARFSVCTAYGWEQARQHIEHYLTGLWVFKPVLGRTNPP